MRANPVKVGQPGSVLTRILRETHSLHIPNVMDDPELREGSAGVGGPRALLVAPLMRDEEVIGVIILRQSHLKPFTPRQIQAIETFADQAVIAISNVNLFNEVQQRTRELAKSLDDLRTAQGSTAPNPARSIAGICPRAGGHMRFLTADILSPLSARHAPAVPDSEVPIPSIFTSIAGTADLCDQ